MWQALVAITAIIAIILIGPQVLMIAVALLVSLCFWLSELLSYVGKGINAVINKLLDTNR